MAGQRVDPQQDDVGHQDHVAHAESETTGLFGMEGDDGVVSVDHRDDRRCVEEVPMNVLHDQRQPGLAGVSRVGFGHRARRRRLPDRPVVRLAVVVAGQPERQQERQRDEGHRNEPRQLTHPVAEVAGPGRAGGADTGRIERRQVVVLRNPVGTTPESPHGGIDDERRQAEVGE
ncbi:Uncharacterised protein [Mycobacteroides abscessus subsp. abscessus]|nr:Uncharacterised protein [Mycobacteroides abscessus subsp. abscessus]